MSLGKNLQYLWFDATSCYVQLGGSQGMMRHYVTIVFLKSILFCSYNRTRPNGDQDLFWRSSSHMQSVSTAENHLEGSGERGAPAGNCAGWLIGNLPSWPRAGPFGLSSASVIVWKSSTRNCLHKCATGQNEVFVRIPEKGLAERNILIAFFG